MAVATGQELRPGDEIAGYRVESVAGRGGMVTATVLTLIVIPVIYYLWRRGHAEVAP